MILKTTDRSTYLDLAKMDWEPSGFPGVWNKVLYEDASGRRTIARAIPTRCFMPPESSFG